MVRQIELQCEVLFGLACCAHETKSGAMDPYAILTCRTQEQRSSTATAAMCVAHDNMFLTDTSKGSEPEWNETFVFNVSDDVPEVAIKLMDSDALSNDDFVGESKILSVFHPCCGPIIYGPESVREDNRGYGEENYRGWRGSS
ncbi:Elicitor-responsive protein 3 [Platanthera guangdongensis]|uniref:Elicitor-responsive protein 3 n=1 Tax=Platanthera guangdongensis TaxID=2320717 RepID=A0ABR2MX81_9ASPA